MRTIEKLVVGWLNTNCYLVYDDSFGVIIDPGGDCDVLLKRIKDLSGIKFTHIINTHGHEDHTLCDRFFKKNFGFKILIHEDDSLYLKPDSINKKYNEDFEGVDPDVLLKDKDVLKIGTLKFSVSHTPGHTPGSILLVMDDVIFSGDTIFKGTIGRVDFEYGDGEKMKESILKILNSFKNNYIIYPGHGKETTLYDEIENLKMFIKVL